MMIVSGVEAAVEPVATALKAIAAPVESTLDPVADTIKARFDPIASPIQVIRQSDLAVGPGLRRQGVEPVIDPFAAGIEPIVNATTSPVQTIVEPFPPRIKTTAMSGEIFMGHRRQGASES